MPLLQIISRFCWHKWLVPLDQLVLEKAQFEKKPEPYQIYIQHKKTDAINYYCYTTF